MPIKYILSFL